jgi:hypothetical protein
MAASTTCTSNCLPLHVVFGIPAVIGMIGAAVVVVTAAVAGVVMEHRRAPAPKDEADGKKPWKWPTPAWLGKPVYTAQTWSAKDSWVTNVTAAGAVLGSITAAQGGIS